MIYRFVVYGEPVGKARARVFKDKAGNIRAVTPTKTRKWEDSIKLQAIAALGGKPLLDQSIFLHVTFIRSFPKSMSKKKRIEAQPTTKPDLDNYIKAVKDALRGIVWRDDSLICSLSAIKCYGDPPRVEISCIVSNPSGRRG
jgi:Holliday junction resolvase RusA-like endonuclease